MGSTLALAFLKGAKLGLLEMVGGAEVGLLEGTGQVVRSTEVRVPSFPVAVAPSVLAGKP